MNATTSAPKTVACNILFLGMGNIPMNVIGESFDEILMRLHAEEANDRYVDAFTEAGQAFRIYRIGIGGIGEKATAAQKVGAIIRPGHA